MKKEIPLSFKVVYILSVIVAFHFFLPVGLKEKVAVEDDVAIVSSMIYNSVPRDIISDKVIDTFVGQLTGYGPDCYGCRGITASGQNVKDGNIYYHDEEFGELRIVAADKKFPFGTIVRITIPNIYESPILAVVLDRGGKITGEKFDLLFSSEKNTEFVGRQKNVKYEVLRYGW